MTQVGKFIEPVILQIKAILSDATTGINSKCDIIDTEYSLDFILDDIKTYAVGERYVFDAGELPALVIWPESDSGGEYTNETLFIESRLTIWIVCMDDDQERLNKRLWRYQDAIIRTIKATDNLNFQVDICIFAGLRFDSPWVGMEQNVYVDAAGVMFNINHEEKVT